MMIAKCEQIIFVEKSGYALKLKKVIAQRNYRFK
jgi:hypothetical protein